MMTNNRVETTLHSDNLMGGLELLYPAPARDHPRLSPLICIGQDLTVDCGSCCVEVSGIFLSPAGGQAYRIIDLMAQRGYLSFSDAGQLSDEIDQNLSNEHFFVFCAGDRGDSVE